MELVSCKFCGKKISSEIKDCIHCGLNQNGYLCPVCNKEITNKEITDPNEIDYTIYPRDYKEFSRSCNWGGYCIHKRCAQQILEIMYACPLCKESLSYIDIKKYSQELRIYRKKPKPDTSPAHLHRKSLYEDWQSKEECRNCGHPIVIELCEACREPVINDGNSGVTVLREKSDERKTYHITCAEGAGYTDYTKIGYKRPEKKSSCFIVTAVHGNHSEEVLIFQEFRDQTLAVYKLGQALIRIYEHLSPPVAKLIARDEQLRLTARKGIIAPMLWIVNKLNSTR